MTIPNKLKVGGKVYAVSVTACIKSGSLNCAGEIDYSELKIRIVPGEPDKMEAVLLHEMMHALADHLGYKEHDEQQIDALANALHMVIKDNPGLFAGK